MVFVCRLVLTSRSSETSMDSTSSLLLLCFSCSLRTSLLPSGQSRFRAVDRFFGLADTIRLRIYAITFGNKLIVAYFAMLASGRLVMAFVTAFVKPSSPMPLQFRLIPNSIGTAFGMSLVRDSRTFFAQRSLYRTISVSRHRFIHLP